MSRAESGAEVEGPTRSPHRRQGPPKGGQPQGGSGPRAAFPGETAGHGVPRPAAWALQPCRARRRGQRPAPGSSGYSKASRFLLLSVRLLLQMESGKEPGAQGGGQGREGGLPGRCAGPAGEETGLERRAEGPCPEPCSARPPPGTGTASRVHACVCVSTAVCVCRNVHVCAGVWL